MSSSSHQQPQPSSSNRKRSTSTSSSVTPTTSSMKKAKSSQQGGSSSSSSHSFDNKNGFQYQIDNNNMNNNTDAMIEDPAVQMTSSSGYAANLARKKATVPIPSNKKLVIKLKGEIERLIMLFKKVSVIAMCVDGFEMSI
ncbi:hypothetical protein Tco_1187228 [Tanacetum coccineum]